MEYISGRKDIQLHNTVVTIGKFDCFHRGHQLLFEIAAREIGDDMKQVVFSFLRNPADVVNNVVSRHVISKSERRREAEKLGTDYFIEYPFDDEIRNMSPESFAKIILKGKLGARVIVCGDDFRFGYGRAGDAEALAELGSRYGFEVRITPRVRYKDNYISSTYIRDEVAAGHLEDAAAMLGRPFFMSGIIEHGHHIGTGMGIPTINFSVPEDKILPPDGVYATRTIIDGQSLVSITNIGVRPTFYTDGERSVETNILDFSADLYGQSAVVEFYKFIRPEMRFSDAESLEAQIAQDTSAVRDYFAD